MMKDLTKKFLLTSIFTIYTMLSGYSVMAADTEIFFADPPEDSGKPNVLFLLNTSGAFKADASPAPEYCGGATKQFEIMQCIMARFIESDDRLNIGFMRYNNPAGPISFPVINPKTPATEEPPIITALAGSENDLIQRGDPDVGIVHDTTSASITLGEEGAIAAFRFTDVDIPQGAVIENAYIRFTSAAVVNSEPLELNISVENSGSTGGTGTGNSVEFDADEDVKARTRTDPIPWTFTSADDWGNNIIYSTPDLAEAFNQVFDNGVNWCGGNAVSVFIERKDTSPEGGRPIATVDDADAAKGPVLVLEWNAGSIDAAAGEGCFTSSTSATITSVNDDDEDVLTKNSTLKLSQDKSDLDFAKADGSGNVALDVQAIGFLFRGLTIPPGAEITSAYIQADAAIAESHTGAFTTTIAAIQNPALNLWEGGFSKSTVGFEFVTWTEGDEGVSGTIGDWESGEKITTPDISGVIQEIVSHPNWTLATDTEPGKTNIPIVFVSNPDATRRLKSAETSFPARLTVTYKGNYVPGVYSRAPEMVSVLYDFVQTGNQATIDTYLEAYRYYAGEKIAWGGSRYKDVKNRVSHPESYVGGKTAFEGYNKNEWDNLRTLCASDPTADICKFEYITATTSNVAPTYKSPVTDGCQRNHIILLVDGDPSSVEPEILNGVKAQEDVINTIKALTGREDCDNSLGGNLKQCGYNLAEYLATPGVSGLGSEQYINTHAIQFGLTTDAKTEFPKAIAAAGKGFYFEAESGAQLETALNNLAEALERVDTSFVSAGITVNQSNRLTHKDELYFSLFRPEAVATWPGNVKRYRIVGSEIIDYNKKPAIVPDTDTFYSGEKIEGTEHTAESWWSGFKDGNDAGKGGAASKLIFSGDRNTFSNLTGDENITFNSSTSDVNRVHIDNILANWVSLLGTTESANILKWVQGQNVNGADPTEMHKTLGDPLHSKPVILTYRTNEDDVGEDVVFVGTNHGFLHAFDTETGIEQWSFIPRFLLNKLQNYVNNFALPPASHDYGVDGSITIYIDDKNGNGAVDLHDNEKVYLFVGLRRGGSSYYAFDITDRTAPKLLHVLKATTGGDFDDLGQTWSKPVIAKLARKNGTFTYSNNGTPDDTSDDLKYDLVMVFGAGYDINQDIAGGPLAGTIGDNIYIVNALNGSKIWDAKTNAAQYPSAGSINAMSSVPADVKIVDPTIPGFIEHIYAADMLGQIFRFDFDTSWSGTGATLNELAQGGMLAELQTDKDGNTCNAATCNRRFYYAPDIAIVPRPGGKTYFSVSIGSGYRAHPLNLATSDQFYGIRDMGVLQPEVKTDASGEPYKTAFKIFDNNDGSEGFTTGAEVIRLANLVDVTERADATATDSPLSDIEDKISPKAGWFISLDEGEKVLAESITFNNRIIFTTYLPPDSVVNQCGPREGKGRAFAVNITDGTAVVDFNNDGHVNVRSMDLNVIGIPPEPQIIVLGSGPQLLIGRQIATELIDVDWGEMDRIKWRERNTRESP